MKRIKIICAIFLLSINSSAQNTLQKLEFLIGNWTVHTEKRLSAAGPWDTSKAKSVIAKAVGSSIIEENYTGTLEGRSFITKNLLAANKTSGKYQMVFIDSEHGNFVDYEGEIKGDSIIFERQFIYPDKSTVKLRWVYQIRSVDEFTMESMRMPESAVVWDITTKHRYKRIKN